MKWQLFLGIVTFYRAASLGGHGHEYKLSSNDNTYLFGIHGFGTEIQCALNTCLKNSSRVRWLRRGEVLFEGDKFKLNTSEVILNQEARHKFHLQHFVTFNPGKDCSGKCSDAEPCNDGRRCLENMCCDCASEEFTLQLKNLSLLDNGHYQCQLDEGKPELDFTLDVLESGLPHNFTKNLTLDYTKCCEKQQVSENCRVMCRPRDIIAHHFDPIACQTDMPKLLHCATKGGNESHEHCCRLQMVPPFCWEFCSGKFTKLRPSHKLCLYWTREILECYERAYLPFPDPPVDVEVDAMDHESLTVCWQAPERRRDEEPTVEFYTVHFKMIPRLPFMGRPGGLPIIADIDNDDDEDDGDDDGDGEDDQDEGHAWGRLPFHTSAMGPRRSSRVESKRHKRSVVVEDEESVWKVETHYRTKRQAWVFVTHNTLTNETTVREFRFKEVNTTNTCRTLKNLRPNTKYFVYVTATNSYGTSLPSVRAIAHTEEVKYDPVVFKEVSANVKSCCEEKKVSAECLPKLCLFDQQVTPFTALDVAVNCRSEFTKVAPCLTDNRNHTPCCEARGVEGDCLGLCDGSVSKGGFSVSSVHCLTLDLYTVHNCLKQGYETHPSEPRKVGVVDVTTTSAVVKWQPPKSNKDKVHSYSVFIRRDDGSGAEKWREHKNASSPHRLLNLHPNYLYMVYVLAHTNHGSSLPSTIDEFYTRTPGEKEPCGMGRPLVDVRGNMIRCGDSGLRCPQSHLCTFGDTDSVTYCCPKLNLTSLATSSSQSAAVKLPDMRACCKDKQVSSQCLDMCDYQKNGTSASVELFLKFGPACMRDINHMIDCGGDGRDHRPCCARAGVSVFCQQFCVAPSPSATRDHIRCVKFAPIIIKCGVEGILKLPGPARQFEIVTQSGQKVKFAWEEPRQKVEVVKYQLKLYKSAADRMSEKPAVEKNTTGSVIRYLEVSELEIGVNYTAHVVSWNEHGSSIPSNDVTFLVEKDSSVEGRPRKPHTVRVVSNSGTHVNITWDWDQKTDDGKPVQQFTFKIFYGEKIRKTLHMWQEKLTNERWLVLSLKEFHEYVAYVVAIDVDTKKISKHSEVIGFQMVADESLLTDAPIPTIILNKNGSSPVFKKGGMLEVKCTARGAVRVELRQDGLWKAEKGVYIIGVLKKEHGNTPIKCTAYGKNGEARTTNQLIFIQHGPLVETRGRYGSSRSVSRREGLKTVLECNVEGYPKPEISWYFRQDEKYTRRPSKKIRLSPNLYDRRFYIESVLESRADEDDWYLTRLTLPLTMKRDEGQFECNACVAIPQTEHRTCSSVWIKVTVDEVALPSSDPDVKACCARRKVPADCHGACTRYMANSTLRGQKRTECFENHVVDILHCAKDQLDLSSCCRTNKVRSSCLESCSPAKADNRVEFDEKCKAFHEKLFGCMVEAQHQLPPPPRKVRVLAKSLLRRSVKVIWQKPLKKGDSGVTAQYAVFYRPADSPSKAWRKAFPTSPLSSFLRISEGLSPNTNYSFAAVAGNDVGWSNYEEKFVVTPNWRSRYTDRRRPRFGFMRSAAILLLLLFVVFAVAVAAVIGLTYFGRNRNKLPPFLRKFAPGGAASEAAESSVAFENPGYDREGQIRGLPGDPLTDRSEQAAPPAEGHQQWQSPKLEAAEGAVGQPDQDNGEQAMVEADDQAKLTSGAQQKGMKYSKFK